MSRGSGCEGPECEVLVTATMKYSDWCMKAEPFLQVLEKSVLVNQLHIAPRHRSDSIRCTARGSDVSSKIPPVPRSITEKAFHQLTSKTVQVLLK